MAAVPARPAPSPTVPPDDALVARVRASDAAAFEVVYRAYYEPLCVFVVGYVRSRAVAEELVQDMLCSIWERRAEWDVRDTVRTYLYRAARNRAVDHLRHGHVVRLWEANVAREATVPGMGQDVETADQRARTTELAIAIRAAVAALPDRCRQVYVLRRQHHLSTAEVAAVLGISAKGVETQLTRALKVLRERLDPFL